MQTSSLYRLNSSRMVKFVLFFAVWLVIIIFFNYQKAHAAISLNPDPGGWIPASERNYLMNCDSYPDNPAMNAWVSPTGWSGSYASAAPFFVNSSSQAIGLRINFAGAVCRSNNVVAATNFHVAPQPGMSPIPDKLLNYNPTRSTPGTYRFDFAEFTYLPPGGFTASGWYNVPVPIQKINWFVPAPPFRCVGSGGTRSGLSDFGPCYSQPLTVPVYVALVNPDNAPTGTATPPSCTSQIINGSASDADSPGTNIDVHIYADAPAGSPGSVGIGSFATSGPGHNFSANVGGTMSRGPRTFYVYAIGVNGSGLANGNNPLIATVIRPACAGTCSISQSTGVMGATYEVTVTINDLVSSPSTPIGRYSVNFNGPGSPTSPDATGNMTGSQAFSTWTGNTPSAPGNYGVSATVNFIDIGTSVTCTGMSNITVFLKPYLKAYGGEVLSGGGFNVGGTCTVPSPTSPAPIGGFGSVQAFTSQNGSGQYVGSSSQLTVSSLLQVNEFYSNSQAGNTSPKSLTIANTGTAEGNSTYGGGSKNTQCITDYYNTTQDPSISSAITNFGSALTGAPGRKQYTVSGDLTIGTGVIPRNHQIAVYVDGDVFINGNISYQTGASNISELPNLYIIAKGNIYIDNDVTNIDGTFIAQTDGPDVNDKGNIYTCTDSNATLFPAAKLATACDKQLVVNGGLIAQEVRFLRTAGSIDTSTSSVETPSYSNGTGTGAAEVINYTPEVYLAPSPLRNPNATNTNTGSAGAGRYDAIKSLPPIY